MAAPSLDELELLMAGGEPPTLAAVLHRMRPAWFHLAACRGVEDASWFPGRGESARQALAVAVCLTCPVREPCLAYALAAEEPLAGVWGATTAKERAAMLGKAPPRRRQIGLRRRNVDEPKKKTEHWGATPIRSRARSRALGELQRRHREEFDRLFDDARAALEEEAKR